MLRKLIRDRQPIGKVEPRDVQYLLGAEASGVPLERAAILRACQNESLQRQDRLDQHDPLRARLLRIARTCREGQHRPGALSDTDEEYRPGRISALEFAHDTSDVIAVLRVVGKSATRSSRPAVSTEIEEQHVHPRRTP